MDGCRSQAENYITSHIGPMREIKNTVAQIPFLTNETKIFLGPGVIFFLTNKFMWLKSPTMLKSDFNAWLGLKPLHSVAYLKQMLKTKQK